MPLALADPPCSPSDWVALRLASYHVPRLVSLVHPSGSGPAV